MTRIDLAEIGTLYEHPADPTSETSVLPLPGYHVNATHPVAGWDAWRVTPATPRQLFAGVQTVCYTFPDRAAYLLALGTAVLTLPAPAPAVVTMRQARLALLGAGLLASVDAAISALPEPTRSAAQIEWQYSQEVHRARPFVQTLGAALQLSAEQLDELFRVAATL